MKAWKRSRCAGLLASAVCLGFWPSRALANSDALAARMASGPSGARAVAIDLSAAHALVREFSTDSAFAVGDAILAQVLADGDGLERRQVGRVLQRYANGLSDVAAQRASAAVLPRARVQQRGSVAIVHPGTGSVELPAATKLVVVDLRRLPATEELAGILPRLVEPALATDVAGPMRLVRTHQGPVDESFTATNVYSTTLSYQPEPTIRGAGRTDLPVVLLVGPQIGPQAASFAAQLRGVGRAWIAGDSVPLVVAESSWQGVGDFGLMVRTSLLATMEAQPPVVWTDSSVAQDEIHARDFELQADTTSIISLSSPPGDDLDLYLVRDQNEDGVFDLATETVAFSASESAEERLEIAGAALPAGRYQLMVHGYFVAADVSSFTFQIEASRAVPLPDEIPADLSAPSHPRDYLQLLQRVRGRTPPPLARNATRSAPTPVSPFGFEHPLAHGRGELRAGLLIAHGMLRLFYPYFPEVGDSIDHRLLETLRSADRYSGDDRVAAWRILRRFGAALSDGHQFVYSRDALFESNLPVFLEHAGVRPIVRRSALAEVQPGDTIVALDGRPIEDVYAEELARTSAATRGYQLDIADRYIFSMNGPISLELEDTLGARRSVRIDLQPIDDYLAVVDPVESERASGPLADLGAPDVYYLNLNTFSTPSPQEALRAIVEASALGSRGMILDMRGYPGGANHYEVAARLIQGAFSSPHFEVPNYVGPGSLTISDEQYDLSGLDDPAFDGPLVLLTGPHAVSAAENFMQMLVGAGRMLSVVGRRSAGTNGNITSVALPGGFTFSYTGMKVRNPDGSRLHGVGIVPDVEVPILATDLRDGIDRALLEALRVLREATEP
jgi:C-terminal processing protease CtpA/Prc